MTTTNTATAATLDMDSLGRRCVEICEERKAEDIRLYDVSETSLLADTFLICTGKTAPHIRAIRDHLQTDLGENGIKPVRVEGTPDSHWTILDFGTLLVHILNPEKREYYLLEELWDKARILYPEDSEE
ncbi:MAG: ribosome silencing factor [Verrucomicrobiota bacterium]